MFTKTRLFSLLCIQILNGFFGHCINYVCDNSKYVKQEILFFCLPIVYNFKE